MFNLNIEKLMEIFVLGGAFSFNINSFRLSNFSLISHHCVGHFLSTSFSVTLAINVVGITYGA